MLDRIYRLPWRSSFPRSGSCNTPRGFLYLSAGVAVIGKIGGHVRLLPPRKRNKRRKHEAASPWRAIYTVQPDNQMGPLSRGGRIQSRMAPGMYQACLNGRDTSESRWPAAWDHRKQLQPQPDAPGPSRIRGAPDQSTDAPWMHRSWPRPALVRDRRRSLQHRPSQQTLRAFHDTQR